MVVFAFLRRTAVEHPKGGQGQRLSAGLVTLKSSFASLHGIRRPQNESSDERWSLVGKGSMAQVQCYQLIDVPI